METYFTNAPHEAMQAAACANRRGIMLRARGRYEEAVEAFRAALKARPGQSELHVNLATALMDTGALDHARMHYGHALALDPDNVPAHLAMFELQQMAHDVESALEHQARALQHQTLFTHPAAHERRRVLVLSAPGDWQANVPVDFLIDSDTTTIHKLFIVSEEQACAAQIPQADAIFIAIAESERNAELLRIAAQIVDRIALPVVNHPLRVRAANRAGVAHALHLIPHLHVPSTRRFSRQALEASGASFAYPLVVRPVDSQAGRDLEKIDDSTELSAYAARIEATAFYVMPFVDFRSPDGYYRKYRIIVVDGEPYPYHLAISPRWMIHYYNAPMTEHAWMRDEEERFLRDFATVFGPPLRDALSEAARVLRLDYFGVDCSIAADGRLLLFEADPAMLVHASDDPALFGYKRPYAQRIFTAFERLIDRARSG